MRNVKLLGLMALALFAFGAFTASAFAVEAEESGKPQILVLEGKASELKSTLKSVGTVELVNTSKEKVITAKEAQMLFGFCENLASNAKDTNLCKDIPIQLTGYKQGEVGCRSENNKKEKDPVETVLVLGDGHLSAGDVGGVLVPLFLIFVLGTGLEEGLMYNCGGLKVRITGVQQCEGSPGLVNIPTTSTVKVSCVANAKNEATFPECLVLCEEFGKVKTLTAEFGEAKLGAALRATFEGNFNKDVYIDD